MSASAVDLANQISAKEGTDLLLLNAAISRGTEAKLASVLKKRQRKKEKAALIVCTEGGDPDAAFRIARHVQDAYKEHTAIVAGWCKSAGTLICVGANKIVMGPLGELGPLDVQLAKPDDLGGMSSGLTLDSAFRSLKAISFDIYEHFLLEMIKKSGGRITTRTAAQISAKMTSGLMSRIFEQIDPVKVGEDFRSTRIAEEYAERLNFKSKNLILTSSFDAMEALVRGYPSHGFVIDKAEAGSFFHRVEPLVGDLAVLIDQLAKLAVMPQSSFKGETEIVMYLNEDGTTNAAQSQNATSAPPHGGSGQGSARKPHSPVPAPPTASTGDVSIPPKERRARQKPRQKSN